MGGWGILRNQGDLSNGGRFFGGKELVLWGGGGVGEWGADLFGETDLDFWGCYLNGIMSN